ncbi:MAG: glycine--tRNA ligase subunit beta [Proteobacteria bacterium]|jgi:glycyl-tRNA synthetase beta chain|nr:glycine--tRNA ligase subunit beta [Pseudomonadota bacterium]
MRTETLLLEIGTEELPPKSLKPLADALTDGILKGLKGRGFECGEVTSLGSPRRLATQIRGVAEFQADQAIEKRGPSVAAAYDDQGQPTKALLGFARSCGIDHPEQFDFDRLKTDKGEWVVFRETRPGKRIDQEIAEVINQSIASLPIERPMRWGAGRAEFARPVHWIVLLYGDEVIEVDLLGVRSGRASRGHRFMSPELFDLPDSEHFSEACRAARVIVDFDERRQTIRDALILQAGILNASLTIEEGLLDEVTALVEWPVVLSGHFDAGFLEIPDEVLISAMREHQRYFHLRDAAGVLLPVFMTVANIESTDPALVIAGNERVIKPRLSDAAFFFRSDTRTSLEEGLPRLKQVVFQTKLGTYHDKARRISVLAGRLAGELGGNVEQASRAGLLCKVDLVSDLVGEFPDLQGVMGGYYAIAGGESEAVAAAIRTHYQPVVSGGDIPKQVESCCVALADKMDTLVGIFGIGQPPTGSRDPFALRRQSLGIIRIIIENELTLDLPAALEAASEGYGNHFDITEVYPYLLDRLTYWYQDNGIDPDVIQATRGLMRGNLLEADRRIRAVQAFKHHAKAANLIAANKRVANILRHDDALDLPEVDPSLFEFDAEKALHQALDRTRDELANAVDDEQRLLVLAGQQEKIDRYFDDVLVMAEDEAIRRNRLATLAGMRGLFLQVADFSLLQ